MTCGHYASLQWSFATLSVVLPILEHLKEKKSSIMDAIEAALDGHFPNYLLPSLSNKNLYNIFCTLSRGVQPLTRADDLWLASLDFLVLCVFIWQETTKYFGSPVNTVEACDTASSARLWFALTIRQSCLMVVSGLTLLHIRMGRSVSFGAKQWMIWAPTLLLSITSTVLAAVLSGASIPSLFIGLVTYSTSGSIFVRMEANVVVWCTKTFCKGEAMLSTAAFSGLVYTLVSVCHNLTTLHELANSWPPAKEEGSSWLTSDAGSHHDKVSSNWSFPTYHMQHGTSPTCVIGNDPDPFHHDIPSCPCLGSQSSWLTLSIATPAALLTAQVLGGYGYTADSEKGITSLATKGSGVEISYARYMSWLLSIWVPMPPLAVVLHTPSPADTLAMYVRDYKGSGSVTIVKGHHSGDVWISQGDAVDGKGKVGQALGLMSSIPRLAVLPISKEKDEGEREEMYALRIMIAQRHYSTLATTVVILASPERQEDPVDAMTSIVTAIMMEDLDISPPPSDPLPLTLPNIHNVKLAKQLMHKKSYSSGFSLGAVVSEDMNEIDMLPAGVLPLLVPGLKVSKGMKIKEWEFSPPLSSTVSRKPCCMPKESNGLSLGKDALQSWKSEVNWALANKIHQYLTLPVNDNTWRNTVWGGESVPNLIAHPCTGESQLQVPTSGTSLSRLLSTCILGLHPKVPHSMDSTYISDSYSFTLQYTLLAASLHIYVKNSWVFQMVQLKRGPEMNGKMGNVFKFLHSDHLRSTLPGCPCIQDVEMGNMMQDIKVSLCKLRTGLDGAKKLLGNLLGGQMHYMVKSGLQPRICQTGTCLATSRKRGYRHSSNAMIVLLGVVVGPTQHYALLALHNGQALVKFMRQEIMLYLVHTANLPTMYALLALHNGQALVKFMRQETMLYLVHTVNLPMTVKDRVNSFFSSRLKLYYIQYALLALHNSQALSKFTRQSQPFFVQPAWVNGTEELNGHSMTQYSIISEVMMGSICIIDKDKYIHEAWIISALYQYAVKILVQDPGNATKNMLQGRQDLHTEVHGPNRVKPRGDTKYVRHCEVQ
ncbi:hypothetical protein EDD17DRAFT_1511430 [Pisolithus thermaeus]|nr:hypothetical protein EDD17DRAFT_1511430 [Pisolithus thermaeus]